MTGTAKKKFSLIMLAALLALAAVCAAAFVFTRLHHDHVDAHCPVCLEIQNARHLLEGLARCAAAALAAGLTGMACRPVPMHAIPSVLLQTPVTLKVRFNS